MIYNSDGGSDKGGDEEKKEDDPLEDELPDAEKGGTRLLKMMESLKIKTNLLQRLREVVVHLLGVKV